MSRPSSVAPEGLLLAILVGAVGERPLVDDTQAQETLGDFVGHHRRAVVGQESTGQAAFLDRLGEPVHQVLGGLREVPLDVAAEPRVVVEDAQRDRPQPLAAGGEHLERTVVEIEMPETPDVRGFVAADLARLASHLGTVLPRGAVSGGASACAPSRAPSCSGGPWHTSCSGPSAGSALHQRGEVVVVELVAPVRVVVVLETEAARPGPGPGRPCRSPCARRGGGRRRGRRRRAAPCSTTARW